MKLRAKCSLPKLRSSYVHRHSLIQHILFHPLMNIALYSMLLFDHCAFQIRPSLPPLFRLAKKWTLLYSLDQHGISLATFYSRVSPHCAVGGCLLVLRDADEHTFGVWMGDGIRKSTSIGAGRGYYGSGESFLWKQENDGASVRVFKWTGKNDYVALCESDYISFGGG